MKTCKTCKHWKLEPRGQRTYGDILCPIDPDTFEPMATTFEVRSCGHPALLFCERPLEINGFAIADGSGYMAGLYTAEDFGCVRHEGIHEAVGGEGRGTAGMAGHGTLRHDTTRYARQARQGGAANGGAWPARGTG